MDNKHTPIWNIECEPSYESQNSQNSFDNNEKENKTHKLVLLAQIKLNNKVKIPELLGKNSFSKVSSFESIHEYLKKHVQTN